MSRVPSREDTARPATFSPLGPYNTEAEQGLLGAILLNNRAFEKVADFLRPEHFYDPAHARIFEAISGTVGEGRLADPVTLHSLFEHDRDIGGAAYLSELVANVVSVVNAEHYGRLIHDCWMRRELFAAARELEHAALEPAIEGTAKDLLEAHEARLFDLAERGQAGGRSAVSVRTATAAAMARAETAYRQPGGVTGIRTGLAVLDRSLGGLHQSDLIIVAGRPSMGKTGLAVNSFARASALAGHQVAVFSLEMSADQLGARMLAAESGISTDRQVRGQFRDIREWQELVEARHRVDELADRLWIDDTAGLSVAQIRQRARRLKRRRGLDLIVVDHLGKVRPPRELAGNPVAAIGAITGGLKEIAKELGIPVVALSQLSRQVEMRDDKRPQLADLRQSGDIEQDADVVMFVFREQYYLERAEPAKRAEESDEKFAARSARWQQQLDACRGWVDLIIAKNRMGPVRAVKARFDEPRTLFYDHYDQGKEQDDLGAELALEGV